MGDARSNFLRRKRELAKDAKQKAQSTISTSVWLMESTQNAGIVYLRCSACKAIRVLTDKQMERYEYPCMCPECKRYMLGVENYNGGIK